MKIVQLIMEFDVDCSIPLVDISAVLRDARYHELVRFRFEKDAVTISCGKHFSEQDSAMRRIPAADLWSHIYADPCPIFRVSCPYTACVSYEVIDGFLDAWNDEYEFRSIDERDHPSKHCLRFQFDRQRNMHLVTTDVVRTDYDKYGYDY